VVPVEPGLLGEVKFFGQHKGSAVRDGVLLTVEQSPNLGATVRQRGDLSAMDAKADLVRVPSRAPSIIA
jgi:hypothetical protein